MAAADDKDTETYYLAVTAEVLGQTISYTFVVTYEDGLDLQLQFTWYEKSGHGADTSSATQTSARR
ncbi:MAG: hypothetical protein ACLRSV_00485 [Oscillospiraceae bacterium]